MRHRYHSTVRTNPLKRDLTQCWIQPPSSNTGLWIIGDLWHTNTHLESLYVTCLCVTPVSRPTGVIYIPEEKERCAATNARHAANGIEWLRGEQKGYRVTECYGWQHRGTRTCQKQHLIFHIQHHSRPSGGAFCETVGHTVLTLQAVSPWIIMLLPGAGHSWPPSQALFFSFFFWSPRAGSCTHALFPVTNVDVGTAL